MAARIFRINYKSDFILTLNSDAGWMTPFCIKFWTGAPSQAFFVGWDGTTYTHCSYDPSEPTKLVVQFDDHHLPIGDLKFQIAYHFTVADFPNDVEDEVLNQSNIVTEIDGNAYQVMLDFTGETAPEIQFSLPAYANEAQRIVNEQQRIAAEETRIDNEAQRIQNEETRINQEQARQDNEAQRIRNEQTRISQEEARVREFATLKRDAQEATTAANDAAALANQKAQLAADKAQLAADKAALAQDAANLANQKAQLAADKAALAQDAADLANQKAQLAQQKAEYAQSQGDYAKQQGDYAKEQGDYAKRKGDDAAAQMQQQAQAFSEAQAARQTSYEQAEGTESGSVAGDGSRWGAFKTNEAARDAKVDAKVADITNLQEAVAEGAVYDVSAKNPTAGPNNDGKWESLSALLSDANLNTLIPSAFRRGGMSIKFVLSSDNKYVQYFLPKDEWSATPSDWEKINLEEEVSQIGQEVDGIDTIKKTVTTDVPPSFPYNDSMGETVTSVAIYNSFIFTTPNDTQLKITSVRLRVYKVTGATYNAKLVTTENNGRLKITAIQNIQLTEPTNTFQDETIELAEPFVVPAGSLVGIIADTNGIIRTSPSTSQGYQNSVIYPRSVTYANMTVGNYVWPYNPTTPQTVVFPFTLLNETKVFQQFATEEFVEQKDAEVLAETEEKIAITKEDLTNLYINGYPIEWQIGVRNNAGVYNPAVRRSICLKTPIHVKKGQIIKSFASRPLTILSVDDGAYSVLATGVYSFVFPDDVFILVNVEFSSSAMPVVSDNQIVAINNGSEIIVIEDYDVRKSYDNWKNEVANYVSVRNSLDLSIDEQKMTHVASCEYDPFLKVFWLVYYANNVVTIENSDDIKTYLTLTQFNPYTGTFKRCELLKANETKGGFSQGNMPPYDPAIAGISQTGISILFECFDTQHGIAKMIVTKADFETAISSGTESPLSGLKVCDVESITKARLTYEGVQYDVDCSGIKQMYEAFKGQAIGTITDLCMSMKPFHYNGIYYATIQDIFNGSGMMPVLMSTTDFVNWSFVKVFNEVTWSTIAESAFVIKDGLVYFCARTATANAVVLVYDITNSSIVCEPYTLQFSMDCKPAISIFDGRVILACNSPSSYESGVGFRKNMGIWEMGSDGSCSLLSNILTESGIHYPDWVSANNELYLVFSTDKRFLNRATQRTNLGFAKILV